MGRGNRLEKRERYRGENRGEKAQFTQSLVASDRLRMGARESPCQVKMPMMQVISPKYQPPRAPSSVGRAVKWINVLKYLLACSRPCRGK